MEHQAEELRRLDIIIGLLLRMVPGDGDGPQIRDQIRVLNGFGLRPVEISRVLGKTSGFINKELFIIRKGKAKGVNSQ